MNEAATVVKIERYVLQALIAFLARDLGSMNDLLLLLRLSFDWDNRRASLEIHVVMLLPGLI